MVGWSLGEQYRHRLRDSGVVGFLELGKKAFRVLRLHSHPLEGKSGPPRCTLDESVVLTAPQVLTVPQRVALEKPCVLLFTS